MVKVRSSMQWWGAVGSIVLGVLALVVAPPAIGIAVFAAAVALVVFWLTTPLLVGEDEVVVRPRVQARHLGREEIVAVEVVKTQSWPSWQQLRLRLADGSVIDVERVAQRREGGAVDRARQVLAG